MSTPHIDAEPGDFAPIVLMPGDPRRARRIAEEFFTDPRLVTEVRGIEGWTGTVQSKAVSVLASGMGIPSISIYATELFRFFDVRAIIRVGTCGAIADELHLGDVVIGSAAHTDSGTAARVPGVHFSHVPDFDLLAAAVTSARSERIPHQVGAFFSTDNFYDERPAIIHALRRHGTLAVEMEAAALYGIAVKEGRRALAVATVTDHLGRDEALSAQQRESQFQPMVRVALHALLSTR